LGGLVLAFGAAFFFLRQVVDRQQKPTP